MAELTELVDLPDWPEGTRLIVRRDPCIRRPAQPVPLPRVPLLGSLHRPGRRPGRTRPTMRAHAHVEQHI